MDKNVKIAIGLGIVVAAIWYSQKGKGAETSTEEPSSGGGGGGGLPFPSAPANDVPPSPTTTTKPTNTTPSNLSPSLKNATVVTNAGTAPPKPVLSKAASGGFSSASTSQYSSVYQTINCADGKTYNPLASDVKAAGGVNNWCNKNGHKQVGSGIGAPNVPFDGKIERPAYKVDFF